MNEIELKTPEGYFEESFGKTMAAVSRMRKRRSVVLGVVAAVVLVAGITFTAIRTDYARQEEAYLAQQAELAGLDIFLEIN